MLSCLKFIKKIWPHTDMQLVRDNSVDLLKGSQDPSGPWTTLREPMTHGYAADYIKIILPQNTLCLHDSPLPQNPCSRRWSCKYVRVIIAVIICCLLFVIRTFWKSIYPNESATKLPLIRLIDHTSVSLKTVYSSRLTSKPVLLGPSILKYYFINFA